MQSSGGPAPATEASDQRPRTRSSPASAAEGSHSTASMTTPCVPADRLISDTWLIVSDGPAAHASPRSPPHHPRRQSTPAVRGGRPPGEPLAYELTARRAASTTPATATNPPPASSGRGAMRLPYRPRSSHLVPFQTAQPMTL